MTNHNIKIDNKYYGRVEQFKYLGTTITNQISIHEETEKRRKSETGCYHLVQNLLSSSLLSKNIKSKIYKIIILPVVLYVCEIWSLTLRKEHRLRVFENRMLTKMLGPERDEVPREWRRLYKEDLNDLYSSPNIIRVFK
jgi:hypothetical protein